MPWNDHSSLPVLRVERAGLALHVGRVFVAEAFEHRRADEDRVVDDGRRRVQADFRLLEVGLLAVDDDALLEVDDTVGAEARHGLAGLGVERDQAVTGGDVDDALVTLAVGPVGEAAARQLARRPARGALAFVQAVGPLDLAGGGFSATTARRVPAVA